MLLCGWDPPAGAKASARIGTGLPGDANTSLPNFAFFATTAPVGTLVEAEVAEANNWWLCGGTWLAARLTDSAPFD